MKKYITYTFILLTAFAFCIQTSSAQITITFPKIKKPKVQLPTTNQDTVSQPDTNVTGRQNVKTGSNAIYPNTYPTDTPVLLKNSVYVQAKIHDEYWKVPGQRDYSSFVPVLSFSIFCKNEASPGYKAEYYNPDGSLWYSEKMEPGFYGADYTRKYQSESPFEMLKTKSAVATGVYSFKIINEGTGETAYQGKFKVGKFSRAYRPQEKNKADFYVEHDWLLPMAMVGFHHSSSLADIGGVPLLVSFWLKGDVSASDLEGRVFYNGKQITSTKDGGGASDYDERISEYAPAFAADKRWKRWEFQWSNFLVDNNGGFNRENYPNAFYFDKNPGEYTVKIYLGGAQIREVSFTVGADGRIVRPAYSDQIPMPFHRIILPAKVIGTAEKWNPAAAKTESLYGNSLTGFTF